MLEDDIFRLCRLCLKSGEWAIDIFDPKGTDGFLVWFIMKELVGIQASRGDGMPGTICDDCMTKLSEFKNFKKMCIHSRIEFLKLQVNSGLIVQMKTEPGINEYTEDTQDFLGEKNAFSLADPLSVEDMKPEVQVKTETGSKDDSMDTEDLLRHSEDQLSLRDSPGLHDLKSEASDGSFHEPKADPDDGNDSAGSRVRWEDHEAFSEQESLSRVASSVMMMKEESGALLNNLNAPNMTDASKRWTGTAKRRSSRGRSEDWRGSHSLSGRRKFGETFFCDECGASFGFKTSLFTHIRGHQREKNYAGPGKVGRQSRRNESGIRFHCADCKEIFATCRDLDGHVRKKHTQFICDHCGKACTQKVHLVDHMHSSHFNTRNLACKVPGRTSMFPESLRLHTACQKKRDKMFICDHCGKGFAYKVRLFKHINAVYLGLKPFRCSICSKDFPSRSGLKSHVLIVHIGERRFECEVCGKAFKTDSNLKSHMRTHLKKRPFSCTLCPRSFLMNWQLRLHMKSHGGLNNGRCTHTCEVCGKEFKEAVLLYCHMRRHSEERPYKCKQCPKEFKTRQDLTKHAVVHSGIRNYPCGVCKKKFSRSGDLSRHLRTHDGKKPFECEVCHKKFGDRGNLRKHMVWHNEKTHECQECHKWFHIRRDLKRHVEMHSEKRARPFKCEECGATFCRKTVLKRHMSTHTGFTGRLH